MRRPDEHDRGESIIEARAVFLPLIQRRQGLANLDPQTVAGFGTEWSTFDQSALPDQELAEIFDVYFDIFPWEQLPPAAVGFDLGCGSGRFARLVSPRVGHLHCIDPAEAALTVARRNLRDRENCTFHLASVEEMPLADGTMDFGYSLGVLHHVPDTAAGIRACVAKLKPGAPFLLYLYYAFDNRPAWYRAVWRASDLLRRIISRLPLAPKRWVSFALALLVYWPLARLALVAERRGYDVQLMPLASYRHRSFYTMQTDAYDRFCTRLEQRFTARQIEAMMEAAGLERIRFSQSVPYWCAIGYLRP